MTKKYTLRKINKKLVPVAFGVVLAGFLGLSSEVKADNIDTYEDVDTIQPVSILTEDFDQQSEDLEKQIINQTAEVETAKTAVKTAEDAKRPVKEQLDKAKADNVSLVQDVTKKGQELAAATDSVKKATEEQTKAQENLDEYEKQEANKAQEITKQETVVSDAQKAVSDAQKAKEDLEKQNNGPKYYDVSAAKITLNAEYVKELKERANYREGLEDGGTVPNRYGDVNQPVESRYISRKDASGEYILSAENRAQYQRLLEISKKLYTDNTYDGSKEIRPVDLGALTVDDKNEINFFVQTLINQVRDQIRATGVSTKEVESTVGMFNFAQDVVNGYKLDTGYTTGYKYAHINEMAKKHGLKQHPTTGQLQASSIVVKDSSATAKAPYDDATTAGDERSETTKDLAPFKVGQKVTIGKLKEEIYTAVKDLLFTPFFGVPKPHTPVKTGEKGREFEFATDLAGLTWWKDANLNANAISVQKNPSTAGGEDGGLGKNTYSIVLHTFFADYSHRDVPSNFLAPDNNGYNSELDTNNNGTLEASELVYYGQELDKVRSYADGTSGANKKFDYVELVERNDADPKKIFKTDPVVNGTPVDTTKLDAAKKALADAEKALNDAQTKLNALKSTDLVTKTNLETALQKAKDDVAKANTAVENANKALEAAKNNEKLSADKVAELQKQYDMLCDHLKVAQDNLSKEEAKLKDLVGKRNLIPPVKQNGPQNGGPLENPKQRDLTNDEIKSLMKPKDSTLLPGGKLSVDDQLRLLMVPKGNPILPGVKTPSTGKGGGTSFTLPPLTINPGTTNPVEPKPTDKETPQVSGQEQPVVKTTSSAPVATTYSRVAKNAERTLPNTGEKDSVLAIAGATVLGTFGLAATRKRKVSK